MSEEKHIEKQEQGQPQTEYQAPAIEKSGSVSNIVRMY